MRLLSTLAILLIALILFKRAKQKKWNPFLPPENILFFGLGCSILAFNLRLIGWKEPDDYTWGIILLGVLSFVLGSFSLDIFVTKQNFVERRNYAKRLFRTCLATTTVGTIFGVLYIWNAFKAISSGFFLERGNVYELYNNFGTMGGGSFYVLNILVLPLNVLGYFQTPNKKYKFLYLIMACLNTIMLIAAMQKANFTRAIFITLLLLAFFNLLDKKKIITFIVAFSIFFVGLTILRSPYYGSDYKFIQKRGILRVPKIMSWISAPYLYYTSGISAFDDYLLRDKKPDLSFGKETFSFAYVFLNKFDNRIKPGEHHKEFADTVIRTNVYTIFRSLYEDFYVHGVFFMMFVYGVMTKFIFLKVHRGKIEYLLLYGVLSFAIFMSFFSNHFSYITTVVLGTWSLFIGLYTFRGFSWN